jgi:hypothetical protein
MRAFGHFGRFWYDFVVGDDWTMAIGVIAAIALTWVAARADLPAWLIMPVAVFSLLALSVGRAWRAASPTPQEDDTPA